VTRKHSFSRIALALVVVGGCQAQVSGLLGKKSLGGGSTTSSSGGGGEPASAGSGGAGPSGGNQAAPQSDSASVATTGEGGRPSWCDVDGAAKELNPGGVQYTLQATDARDIVFDLAEHFCAERPTMEKRAELEALHARISKQLMMNDADWKDAVAWALEPQVKRNAPSLRVEEKRGIADLDPIEQYALLSSERDPSYYADALGDRLSATGRMGYVEWCLSTDRVGAWAVCHDDVLALDASKISAEIRASSKRSAYERTTARLAMDRVRQRAAARIAEVKKRIDADAAYGKLFETASATRKAWGAKVGADVATLALAMDDARLKKSRKAFENCATDTWAAFSRAVAKFSAAQFAELGDSPERRLFESAAGIVLNDTDVYLAANAMIICIDGTDGKPDLLARTVSEKMQFRAGLRGPRTAAQDAIVAANIKLDDRDARIEFPDIDRPWLPRSSGYNGGGRGIVADVKTSGDDVVISFKKDMKTGKECVAWKSGRRIDHIDQYGRVWYEEHCTKYKTVHWDAASAPVTVSARYATGVKPGVYVDVIENLVTFVRPKEDGALTAVLGVAVK
jgi:hypothetical protein